MLDRVNEDRGLLLAILTVSDRAARGERADLTGPELKNFVTQRGGEVTAMAIVPDEKEAIKQKLMEWCDCQNSPEIILTTGGTGLSPRDVTPEATLEVIEKEVPGLAEAMRAESLKKNSDGYAQPGGRRCQKANTHYQFAGKYPRGARESGSRLVGPRPCGRNSLSENLGLSAVCT